MASPASHSSPTSRWRSHNGALTALGFEYLQLILPRRKQQPHLKCRESTNSTEKSGVHHKPPLEIFVRFQLSRKLDRVNLDFLHGNAHHSNVTHIRADMPVHSMRAGERKVGEAGHLPGTKSAVRLSRTKIKFMCIHWPMHLVPKSIFPVKCYTILQRSYSDVVSVDKHRQTDRLGKYLRESARKRGVCEGQALVSRHENMRKRAEECSWKGHQYVVCGQAASVPRDRGNAPKDKYSVFNILRRKPRALLAERFL